MTSTPTSSVPEQLIALERQALERWCHGNPSRFLELSAPDVAYFDPFLDRRLDGLPALTDYYESLRGRVSVADFELVNPVVQVLGDAALLTFNFRSVDRAGVEQRWNCTELYRRDPTGWHIIHTHWSLTRKSQ